jgi:hypothetical protein
MGLFLWELMTVSGEVFLPDNGIHIKWVGHERRAGIPTLLAA